MTSPSSTKDKQRIALIGFGLSGQAFHAPLIDATPGLSLAAVITANPERAQTATACYPQADILPNTEALWQRAADFDAVVVASPNAQHAEQALAGIEAGLAVVVDKPLAVSTRQAQNLIQAAEAHGTALTVFHNRRWDADFLTLQALLKANRLGAVHRFESRFERWRPTPKAGWRRAGEPAVGGGLLFDLGSHLVDQALTLFGPVARVYAELEPRYADSVVDDDSFLALTHTSGVISHLSMSSVAADTGPRFRVLGENAAYVKYGLDPQEAALRAGTVPGGEDWGAETESAWGRINAGNDGETLVSQPGDYPAFYRQFAAALTGEAALPVDPVDALAGLTVIEAAHTAAAEQRVVTL